MATPLIVMIVIKNRRMPMSVCQDDCSNDAHFYAEGVDPPHYPVPAIREWYEWGDDFFTRETVLIHVQAGRYDG